MEGSFLQDLQVFLVLLVLVVRLALRAFLDRSGLEALLGHKVKQVRQGLQALMASLVQKGLLVSLAFLENQACRAYLFHPFQAHQDLPVQEASALQEVLDLQAPSDPQDLAQQGLLDQLDHMASMDWQDLSGLPALWEMLDQAVPSVLPDLLATLDLSALSALPAAQQEILALLVLQVLLVRPDLQGQMDTV